MFSDRLWIVKAGVALGLLAWLCQDTRRTFSVLHPEVEVAALDSVSLRTRRIHIWAKQVQTVDATGFQISTGVGPVRIVTPAQPPVGEYVSIIARPTGPRTLEALALQVNHGYAWKRPLNYGISILTVLGYLWIVRRRFRWRIADGVFRGKY
jgi:hypothetical protein